MKYSIKKTFFCSLCIYAFGASTAWAQFEENPLEQRASQAVSNEDTSSSAEVTSSNTDAWATDFIRPSTVVTSSEANENNPPIDYPARIFHETDFEKYTWLKEFTNVIVINKADAGSDKQTLRLYHNGKLKEFTRVSTGRERFERGCAPGQNARQHGCANRSHWSDTPTGYFDVDNLDARYFSRLWETWMPYSVFFHPGIATHQAPAGTESKLGKRASGGCIRLHPSSAPAVYYYVEQAGKGLIPKILRNGEVAKTAHGDIIRQQGYKTLVIVQNVVR